MLNRLRAVDLVRLTSFMSLNGNYCQKTFTSDNNLKPGRQYAVDVIPAYYGQ
jgi:hypothetical protein